MKSIKENSRSVRGLAAAIVIAFVSSSFCFGYSSGSGTAEAPYQIADVNDLLELAGTTEDYNKCFIMTADINMGGQVFTTAIIAADTNLSSGFQGTAFGGAFDGNNHKVTNFTINGDSNDYIGLFGTVEAGGSIKNLGLEDCNVSGDYRVGGFVGDNYGSITNCYLFGAVNGSTYVGGLVGRNDYGNISQCSLVGNVSGAQRVGGLVAYNYRGTITDCNSMGQFSASEYSEHIVEFVGGLVGYNNNGQITNCYSAGVVTGKSNVGGLVGYSDNFTKKIVSSYAISEVNGVSNVGGLVGNNIGTDIMECYTAGKVSGTNRVGGLAGRTAAYGLEECRTSSAVYGNNYVGGLVGFNDDSVIENCYAVGAVDGNEYTAGLMGYNYYGNIYKSYAAGFVTGNNHVGGLVGGGYSGVVENSVWDMNSSGQASSSGGTGKTTTEMQTMSTFTDEGWDLIEIWDIGENQTYPFLRTHLPSDINKDGETNFYDLAILASHWLEGY